MILLVYVRTFACVCRGCVWGVFCVLYTPSYTLLAWLFFFKLTSLSFSPICISMSLSRLFFYIHLSSQISGVLHYFYFKMKKRQSQLRTALSGNGCPLDPEQLCYWLPVPSEGYRRHSSSGEKLRVLLKVFTRWIFQAKVFFSYVSYYHLQLYLMLLRLKSFSKGYFSFPKS